MSFPSLKDQQPPLITVHYGCGENVPSVDLNKNSEHERLQCFI